MSAPILPKILILENMEILESLYKYYFADSFESISTHEISLAEKLYQKYASTIVGVITHTPPLENGNLFLQITNTGIEKFPHPLFILTTNLDHAPPHSLNKIPCHIYRRVPTLKEIKDMKLKLLSHSSV